MTATTFILAALGAKAFYLLMVWLASAWAASEIALRKGYPEKLGLGTGLLLSFIGVIIWLLVPAREHSVWKERGLRRRTATAATPQPDAAPSKRA